MSSGVDGGAGVGVSGVDVRGVDVGGGGSGGDGGGDGVGGGSAGGSDGGDGDGGGGSGDGGGGVGGGGGGDGGGGGGGGSVAASSVVDVTYSGGKKRRVKRKRTERLGERVLRAVAQCQACLYDIAMIACAVSERKRRGKAVRGGCNELCRKHWRYLIVRSRSRFRIENRDAFNTISIS